MKMSTMVIFCILEDGVKTFFNDPAVFSNPEVIVLTLNI